MRDDALLFSESLSRFVIEIRPDDASAFAQIMAGIPHARIGMVTGRETGLVMRGRRSETVLAVGVDRPGTAVAGPGSDLRNAPCVETRCAEICTRFAAHRPAS